MTSPAFKIPEIHDFVSVTVKHVEYYGYVDDLDLDVRSLRAKIEFLPGHSQWFDLKEVKRCEFPEESKK